MSQSLEKAKKYLGKEVNIIIDRPVGSKHPHHGFRYLVNYGYVPGTKSADGEAIDAYVLGVSEKKEMFDGVCIAVLERKEDDDPKLIVVPEGTEMSDKEISAAVEFQEKLVGEYNIIRSA